MFSRVIGRRCYSTPKAASKLGVKHNGSPSIQVSTKSCINIDDFADKVKQKLNTNCQVALFTSLDKEPLNELPTDKLPLILNDEVIRDSHWGIEFHKQRRQSYCTSHQTPSQQIVHKLSKFFNAICDFLGLFD
jgi:hypothetical protein